MCLNPVHILVGDSTAKVVKFEQITTDFDKGEIGTGWWFYRKGSEIWANHNNYSQFKNFTTVGDSTAKVVKFEQITTLVYSIPLLFVLVILPQR